MFDKTTSGISQKWAIQALWQNHVYVNLRTHKVIYVFEF